MNEEIFSFSTNPPKCEIKENFILLERSNIDLFDKTAHQIAKEMARPKILSWDKKHRVWEVKDKKDLNKITQLRKFYDEVCMWESKTKNEQSFAENLPFIKMLNAKVAYARSREYIDDKFVAMFSACLEQINETNKEGLEKFKLFRTFFEAFYGFYRAERI